MDLLETAERIAREAHSGQFRRDGVTPYITHPERVVARLKAQGASPVVMATGWLHDVVEDTGIAITGLLKQGIPWPVTCAIEALTKTERQSYTEFIRILDRDTIAREVKIADILDNLSDAPTEKQIIKYCKALLYLHGIS